MKLNFMLIDDSSIVLFAHLKVIEKEVNNAEVITFIKAKLALDYISKQARLSDAGERFIPDIILVDLHMPEMDGIEFLDALIPLRQGCLQKTKIYILSSSLYINDIINTRNHVACDGFISKPLSAERVQQLAHASRFPVKQKK